MRRGVRRHPHRQRKTTDAVEAIKGHTNGFAADVAIDAVGHPAVFEQAFDARARGQGRVKVVELRL